MTVGEIYDICEACNNLLVVADIKGKRIPVGTQYYVVDSIDYKFCAEEAHMTTDCFMTEIEDEAKDTCWFDWRYGSTFLDCKMMFVENVVNFDDAQKEDIHSIDHAEITDKELILHCN